MFILCEVSFVLLVECYGKKVATFAICPQQTLGTYLRLIHSAQ